MLSIRPLMPSDVAFAMRMVEIVGWNQISADWDRLRRIAPQCCLLAEWDGQPAGTATAVAYGTDCAWIGMVLVDPAFRGRGIGSGLIAHCLALLKEQGVRTIKLDATDDGRRVYLKQGFVDEYGTLRHVGSLRPAAVPDADCRLEPLAAHRHAVKTLDLPVFGADRSALLAVLAEQRPGLALVALRNGEVVGYGLARPGRVHGYIGPVVTGRMEVAQVLVAELARRLEQPTVFVDTTVLDERWCHWLQESGLKVQRRLMRMYLGTNDRPGDPQRVYTLSAFETG